MKNSEVGIFTCACSGCLLRVTPCSDNQDEHLIIDIFTLSDQVPSFWKRVKNALRYVFVRQSATGNEVILQGEALKQFETFIQNVFPKTTTSSESKEVGLESSGSDVAS